MDKEETAQKIRAVNRKILNLIETELVILKEDYPELEKDVDNMFKRVRKGVLDVVGDCEREVTE